AAQIDARGDDVSPRQPPAQVDAKLAADGVQHFLLDERHVASRPRPARQAAAPQVITVALQPLAHDGPDFRHGEQRLTAFRSDVNGVNGSGSHRLRLKRSVFPSSKGYTVKRVGNLFVG